MFLANYSNERCTGYSIRYTTGDNAGEINTKRFINTLDYSLDLIKLREVYEKVYRNMGFTFERRGKQYLRRVINVTFKYSVKEYNRYFGDVWIKFGYTPEDITLDDNVCVMNDELVAIRLNEDVETPVSTALLGEYFRFENGKYIEGKSPKVVYTVADLRERLYKDGFVCDGIRFCRFKRSSGSSRVGKCLFIDEQMYSRMHRWEMCGLKVKDGQEVDLAALEAYIALTLSSIVGTIHIRPENFLVIDDYSSVFNDKVIAVSANESGWLVAEERESEISNSIWDGQSLIDKSLMGEYDKYGMILLRNRFFKSACFNCNIQKFFADHDITDVSQLNGFTLAEKIEDVKLITTPSSIKYLKFGKLEKWLEMLEESCDFGVVKHEKPTHFFGGRMVQIHYQLLNTLQMTQGDVNELLQPAVEYLEQLRSDPAVLRYHIKHTGGGEVTAAPTSNDVVYQMLGLTDKFAQTKLCKNYVNDIIASYKKNMRKGHLLVNGNYSVLLGNPVEMMMSAIGKFDGESVLGVGNVYSTRFAFGQRLLGTRSPHVTNGNIMLTTNVNNDDIATYCNVTNEIVCINSIGENLLMRLSGADFDSDTVLLTDNEILIRAAEKNYEHFSVPTSLVEAKKVVRYYTKEDQSDLDIRTSVNKIGEIVNLSQELNTKLWHRINAGASLDEVHELYCDISKLDVLSGIEIDKAKKEFAVDSVAEIKKLKAKYEERDDDGRRIKPNFFGKIARMKGYYNSDKNNYAFHDTTMDYVQRRINQIRDGSPKACLPFSALLKPKDDYNKASAVYSTIGRVVSCVREANRQISEIKSLTDCEWAEKYEMIAEIRAECQDYIKTLTFNKHTAYYLLLLIEKESYKDISRSLFNALFSLPCESFLAQLSENRESVPRLEECEDGDIQLYQFRFKKVQ